MISAPSFLARFLAGVLPVCAMVLGLSFPTAPAQARVFVGVGIGVPFFGCCYGPPAYYPPPYYYPPPVYYAPPPVVYTPPPTAAAPYGQSCNAGGYVCPMEHPVASGSACYCSGNDGQRVPGRAN